MARPLRRTSFEHVAKLGGIHEIKVLDSGRHNCVQHDGKHNHVRKGTPHTSHGTHTLGDCPRPLQRERYLRSTRPHKEDVRRLNTMQLATNTGATIAAKQRRANSPSMSWYLPTNSNPINQTLVSANLLSAQDEAPFL